MADAMEAIADSATEALGQADTSSLDGSPEPTAVVDEGGDETLDDGAEGGAKTEDTLETKLAQAEERINNLRSTHDSQMNKMRDTQDAHNKVLVELAESLKNQNAQRAEPDPAELEALIKSMGADWNPEDPERGEEQIRQLNKIGGSWQGRLDAKINDLRDQMETQIRQQNSDYRQHQEVVDKLTAKGMEFDAAMEFAREMGGGKAAQPAKANAPGTVGNGAGAGSGAIAPKAIQVDQATQKALTMALEAAGVKNPAKVIQANARAIAAERQRSA